MGIESHFYIGRAERIVIAILLCLVSTALALYAWGSHGVSTEESKQTHVSHDSLHRSKDYVGPPERLCHKSSNKFTRLIQLDLNKADSLTLIKVPGIGPAFAHRILALRQKLGGYYTPLQLQEVYGMDEDKFLALKGWFVIKTPPRRYLLDSLKPEELPEHLYLSWAQRKAMAKLLYRHGHISSWAQLMRDSSFTRDDSVRLSHYFIERKSR